MESGSDPQLLRRISCVARYESKCQRPMIELTTFSMIVFVPCWITFDWTVRARNTVWSKHMTTTRTISNADHDGFDHSYVDLHSESRS